MFHPDKKTAFYQKILETRWLEGINPQMQEKIKIECIERNIIFVIISYVQKNIDNKLKRCCSKYNYKIAETAFQGQE
jgi:hypothetical protein